MVQFNLEIQGSVVVRVFGCGVGGCECLHGLFGSANAFEEGKCLRCCGR